MMELATVASIQDEGIPIPLDENLNAICPNIHIPNIKNSCYITNSVMALLAAWEIRKRTTPKVTDTIECDSELLKAINKELFQPIRVAMTQDSNHKDLHVPDEAIQNIRKKCQEIGWITDERQHCISDFLAFLLEPLGIALHQIDRVEKTPDGLDQHSVESMGLLHLGLPQIETTGAAAPTTIELTHLIQKAFSPETDGRNITTTTHMRELSDTLIVHVQRAHAVPGEDLLQRSNLRVDFPEQLPIQLLFPGVQYTKERGQLTLRAVICHKGGQNINSGHFHTMLRTRVPGSDTEKWVKVDDLIPKSIEVVKEKDWLQNESIQSGACIWIYERHETYPTDGQERPLTSGEENNATYTKEQQGDRNPTKTASAQPPNNEEAQFYIRTPLGPTGVIKIPTQATIEILKQASASLTGIPTTNFFMVYGSKALESEKTLLDYNITPESTITIRLRCKGGGKDAVEEITPETDTGNYCTADTIDSILSKIAWDERTILANINQQWRSQVRAMHHEKQRQHTKWISLLTILYTWRDHVADAKLMRKIQQDDSIPAHRTEKGAIIITMKLTLSTIVAYMTEGGGPDCCRKAFCGPYWKNFQSPLWDMPHADDPTIPFESPPTYW
jgi:hypothetical protein